MAENPERDTPARLARLLMHLRGALLAASIGFVTLTAVLYWFSPVMLRLLQGHLGQKLVFFGIMEPVVSHMKLSALMAVGVMLPFLLTRLFRSVEATFDMTMISPRLAIVTAVVLFYAGAAFCYFVTLPFGIKFLLGFQTEHLRPVISIGKFVDFVVFFTAGSGLVFELPLLITILCRTGICTPESFSGRRRQAILAISVLSAVLTPTPDLMNMSLMALPMYILFEIGIALARINTAKTLKCRT